MPAINPNERVAVFIDFEFFLNGLNATAPGQRHDFEKVVKQLVAPGRLTRAWCYTAPPPPYLPLVTRQKREKFLSRIGNLPFFEMFVGKLSKRRRKVVPEEHSAQILAKYWHEYWTDQGLPPVGDPTLIQGNYWEQKGVDVKMAIDMMAKAHRNEYDVAVVVAGDGDFVELVKFVKEMGKHVVNAVCPNNPRANYFASRRLKDTCDCCLDMNALFLKGCLLPPRSRTTAPPKSP